MYIGASCLRLVSYPPSSCIYLSHVKRGLAVHCGAIECNLASHPTGRGFSWPSFLKANTLMTSSSAPALALASPSGLLLTEMINKTNNNKKSHLRSSHYTQLTMTLRANKHSYNSPLEQQHVTAERAHSQQCDITTAASTPGGNRCFPEGAVACETRWVFRNQVKCPGNNIWKRLC